MNRYFAIELFEDYEEADLRGSPIPCYLASEADARIAELEKALRTLRDEIESDGAPGWTELVALIDKTIGL